MTDPDPSRRESTRRAFLAAAGVSAAGLAGCTGGSDVTDSDGDGVIDSEDYAPQDPDVQSKGDVSGATTSTRPTTTWAATSSTAARTTRRTTRAATTDDAGNLLRPRTEFPSGEAHITAYGASTVETVVDPADPTMDGADLDGLDLWVVGYTYPRDEVLVTGRSESTASNDDARTLTADLDWEPPSGQPMHYMVFLGPEEDDWESVDTADLVHFHESDPFEVDADGVTASRASVPELEAIDDDSGEHHSRTVVEGAIALTMTGSTNGERWETNFYNYKSAYVIAARRDHGRARPEFVAFEKSEGFAGEMAALMQSEAEGNGFTSKREQVAFLIDWVQHLPYVPDDVSTGFDDYTKFTLETLVDVGGDCEDTSILLASVLSAEPFGYDTVLIQPPGHMAAGVYGDDLPGHYYTYDGRDYYYVETTGTGWGIGDLPEAYEGEDVYVHQV